MPGRFLIFEKKIWFLRIFFVFVNMRPYGSKIFKRLLLPQIDIESCEPFSEISSQWSSQKYSFGFFFFFVSVTWDPMGVKTSKRYSSLKSLLNLFDMFLNFLINGPRKGTVLDFWNCEFLIFIEFHHCTLWGNKKGLNYLETSDRRAKRSEIWALGGKYCTVFRVCRVLLTLY